MSAEQDAYEGTPTPEWERARAATRRWILNGSPCDHGYTLDDWCIACDGPEPAQRTEQE